MPKPSIITVTIAALISTLIAQSPADQALSFKSVVYSTAPTRTGDVPLGMDLYVPKRPIRGAVVLAHGGGFIAGSRDLAENQTLGRALATRGFLAAAISYRLHADAPIVNGWATRYADAVRRSGLDAVNQMLKKEGPGWADAVAAAAVDVTTAIAWLRRHASEFGFDPGAVALFGASAGAISSMTVAYTMDDYGGDKPPVAAVIDLRGLLLRPAGGNPIRAGDPPLMIIHGEADAAIPPSFAEAAFAAAQDARVNVEYLSARDYGHELGGAALLELEGDDGETVLNRVDDFLSSAFSGRRRSGASARIRLRRSAFVSDIARGVRRLIESVDEPPTAIEPLYRISKRTLLLHAFADQRRLDWSYWPRTRAGLPLRHMTAQQRALTQAVLASLLSAKGYLQVNHIMLLEEVLAGVETTGFSRSIDDYAVAVFGMPDDTEPWGVRFEGHHVSLNVTIAGGDVSVTPSFVGAAPATIRTGSRAGFSALRYEADAAFRLLRSLTTEQRLSAILADNPPTDILSGQFQVEPTAWDRWRTALKPDGVAASTFTPRQLDLLRRLTAEITAIYRPEISAGYLDSFELRAMSFAWMGGSEPGQPHYFRLQGPRFVFEVDAAQDAGNHVHAVWRDRHNDLGAEALQRHYQRHKH